MVRNDVFVFEKSLTNYFNGVLEVCGVTVLSGGAKIDILCMYNPGLTVTKNELSSYFDQVCNKFVICGDFNAHHHFWDEHHA